MGGAVVTANEEALCRDRREEKFLLSVHDASAIEARVAAELPLLRHEGAGETIVSSVYLDRADGALSRAALSSPDECLKVRLRSYARGDAPADNPSRCVLELKRHRRGHTRKWRVWIDRALVAPLCRGEVVPVEAGRVLRPFLALRGGLGLKPVVAVTYRRRVYQLDTRLRVTIDHDVRWFHAGPELLAPSQPLVPDALAPALGALDGVVLEVKRLSGEMPEWLARALEGAPPASRFSKFLAGLEAASSRGEVA